MPSGGLPIVFENSTATRGSAALRGGTRATRGATRPHPGFALLAAAAVVVAGLVVGVSAPALAARALASPGTAAPGTLAPGATHTVETGDTLSGIAAAVYRDPSAWRAVARQNGIRDPRRLEPGRALLLPKLR